MKRLYIIFFLFILVATSCKKYLDEKSNKKLSTIETLKDLQALLDDEYFVNSFDPVSTEESADNYYISDMDWNGLPTEYYRNTYIWSTPVYDVTTYNDWSWLYDKVYKANTILEDISTYSAQDGAGNIKGQAYFLRGRSFFMAVQTWALAYDSTTAAATPGIPLRLGTNFNDISTRATLQQSYDQIISDLKNALPLLPTTPATALRGSKAAVYALFSAVYLHMNKYQLSASYADSCLSVNNSLLDYNTLSPDDFNPISRLNAEVIYESSQNSSDILNGGSARIDRDLYNLYEDNDLRKIIFFNDELDNTFSFKGSYMGNIQLFSGLATDEIYLNRAESNARLGHISAAMNDLNTLLYKRYKTGTFTGYTATNKEAAIQLILLERRKELLMRGSRWADIKRLNHLGGNISLKRIVEGKEYILPANSKNFALPIPDNVISISGMTQNPRD